MVRVHSQKLKPAGGFYAPSFPRSHNNLSWTLHHNRSGVASHTDPTLSSPECCLRPVLYSKFEGCSIRARVSACSEEKYEAFGGF